MIHAGNTTKEAAKQAEEYSKAHPEMYVIVFECFGLYLSAMKRLNVFAPSDAAEDLKCYWKAGKRKPFTKKQVIADQIATPQMA